MQPVSELQDNNCLPSRNAKGQMTMQKKANMHAEK